MMSLLLLKYFFANYKNWWELSLFPYYTPTSRIFNLERVNFCPCTEESVLFCELYHNCPLVRFFDESVGSKGHK